MTPILYVAVASMIIHVHADYLLQAYQHGWPTYWRLFAGARKWAWWLDWIPHDSWHAVQMVRNLTAFIAAWAFVHAWILRPGVDLAGLLVLYIMAGGLFRSLFIRLLGTRRKQ